MDANSYERQPYTFDRVVRILFTVCALLAALYMLNLLKGVLLPFLVACLIAYILEPIVEWHMKIFHIKSRFIPVILTLLETIALISSFFFLFIPYLVEECTQMANILKAYATKQIDIPFLSQNLHRFIRQNVDWNQISHFLSQDQWQKLIKESLSKSWNFLSSGVALIVGVLSWMIVILYVIFIMLDYEKLMLSFRQLVPHQHRSRVFHIFNDIKSAMNHYFRGQFFIAMLVGIMFSIGFLIIGLPMGVVFGLSIGVMNLVPYLQLISLPIAAFLCLVSTVSTGIDFWTIFWETMAVYVVVQCIQDLILTPKIMGKAMGLNPAIILLSLSVWGALLGFTGLIIALPLTTLILSYYNLYVVGLEPTDPIYDITEDRKKSSPESIPSSVPTESDTQNSGTNNPTDV